MFLSLAPRRLTFRETVTAFSNDGDGRVTSIGNMRRLCDSGGDPWWRNAVVYQVYVRSFCDTDGDGTGDLAGVRSKLDYLKALGVDALWFNPWYPSPMADSGYDVSDYRSIDPSFGTLADAETLITQARAAGIRTIVDIVPNHISEEHEWFRAALAARRVRWSGPGSGSGPGPGTTANSPPNGWQSIFGGAAWTPDEERRTDRLASGICTCSPPSSPT